MPTIDFNSEALIRELDERCWQCSGKGKHSNVERPAKWIGEEDGDPQTCGICHGKGYSLTKAGDALLAFLKRWA